mgnify:CR=1 FL=1
MNAKKIMGAVLVAFLAAALFIGAGAAADDGKDFGTVFLYQNTTKSNIVGTSIGLADGIWNGENGASITVTDGVVYPGANFVVGTYKYNGIQIKTNGLSGNKSFSIRSFIIIILCVEERNYKHC